VLCRRLPSNKHKNTGVTAVSNYRKGLRNKRRVRKYYEQEGWAVADVEDNRENSDVTDKFGVADLIAIDGGDVRLVQSTSTRPKTQGDMQRAADRLGVTVVCATWYDYDGLRLQKYIPDLDESPFSDIKLDSSEVPSP